MVSTTQFAYRKGICTGDALLFVAHTLQSALEKGQDARMVQIDFTQGEPSRDSLPSLFCGSWRFGAVCSNTFSR